MERVVILAIAAGLLAAGVQCAQHGGTVEPAAAEPRPDNIEAEGMACMADKVVKSDAEWRCELTPEQYHITREKGTERAFTGAYYATHTPGVYHCASCGAPLFSSDAKYESGTGWPSFFQTVAPEAVREETDRSHGMTRTEILCNRCDAHLGHVFDDGPPPTGLRYCLNSAALKLAPKP